MSDSRAHDLCPPHGGPMEPELAELAIGPVWVGFLEGVLSGSVDVGEQA